MNIFYLDKDPNISAQMQCDKHVVKMVVESAQMLSTAHRMIDGALIGKKWIHPNRDDTLYKASHINHPCNVWIREGSDNYIWLYNHFKELCNEYTFRYGRIHLSWEKLGTILQTVPQKIPPGSTPFKPAVGDHSWQGDIISTYRSFYCTKRHRMDMIWTKRNIPDWYNGLVRTNQTN